MSNLPIFASPAFQEDLVDSYQVDKNPLADVGMGPIEFNITGNGDFIDLNSITLSVKAKITKVDGSAYADKAEVAFINNALHSMFTDIIVTLGETIVEGGEQQYYLKSIISTLFAYSDTTIEKRLFAAGFVKDDAGKADDVKNAGYLTRRGWTNTGASREFYGKLFVDLFQQSRYLIGNMNMRIKLIKSTNSLALFTNIAGEKPKFVIESAKLFLKKVRPHPAIVNLVESHLSRGAMAHYPIHRTEITMIPTAANSLDITKDQLFYGKVPKILVMCMVDNEALSGVYGKTPFNFKHYNIKEVDLRIDGVSKPILPLTPDFKGGKCLREYMSLLENMNILGKDAYLPFTYEDYLAGGYTFFAWNLTPDYQGQAQDPTKRSNIRLCLKFAEATTTAINVMLYAVFDSTVMIDGSGNVLTDYKA